MPPKKKKVIRKAPPRVIDEAIPAGPIGRPKYPPKIDYRRLIKYNSQPSSVIPYSKFPKTGRPYDYAIGALRSRPILNPLAMSAPNGASTWYGALGENVDDVVTMANLQNALNHGYGPTFEDYIKGRVVSNPLDRQMQEAPPPPEPPMESMEEEEQQQVPEQQYVGQEDTYPNPVAPYRSAPGPTIDHMENMRMAEELRMLREYVTNQYGNMTDMGTDPMTPMYDSVAIGTEIPLMASIGTDAYAPGTNEIGIDTEPELVTINEDDPFLPMFPAIGGNRAPTFQPYRIPPIRVRVKRRNGRIEEIDDRLAPEPVDRIGNVGVPLIDIQ